MRKKQKRWPLALERAVGCWCVVAAGTNRPPRNTSAHARRCSLFSRFLCCFSTSHSNLPLPPMTTGLILLSETLPTPFWPFGFFTGRVRSLLILRCTSLSVSASIRFAAEQKGLSASWYRTHNVEFGMQRVPPHCVCAVERCLQPRLGRQTCLRFPLTPFFGLPCSLE